jgi:hypothetical protein
MNKLRFVIPAVLGAALAAPMASWAADDPPPAETSSQSEELARLKAQLELQQKQIETLKQALTEQQKLVNKAISGNSGETEAADTPSSTAPAAAPTPAETDHKAPNLGEVASTAPIISAGVAPARPFAPLLTPGVATPSAVPTGRSRIAAAISHRRRHVHSCRLYRCHQHLPQHQLGS